MTRTARSSLLYGLYTKGEKMISFTKALNHEITILASDNNGYLVSVGCLQLTYTDRQKLVNDLRDYLDDPELWEKAYLETDPCRPQPAPKECSGENAPTCPHTQGNQEKG